MCLDEYDETTSKDRKFNKVRAVRIRDYYHPTQRENVSYMGG